VGLGASSSASSVASAAEPNVSSISSSPITLYGAKWCPACRSLERGLADRKIPFDMVDVDDNPAAFARARAAASASNAIPLTGVVKPNGDTVWIVGADVDAVDKARRGE
jgi:glutaredoxin